MSRTGTGTITQGAKTCVVTASGTAADSIVIVVLTSDPASDAGGALVESITKSAGVGFTINMSNAVQKATTFDYEII